MVRILKLLITLLLLFYMHLGCNSPIGMDEPGLSANAGQTKLTPPLEWGYTLGGYGARMSKPAEGIHDDIRRRR